MAHVEKWLSERPRRPPSDLACALARDRFWRDQAGRLLEVHPEWPDAAFFLGLGEEIAHALVLALSRQPASERHAFAEQFFAERPPWRRGAGRTQLDAQALLRIAARIALLVLDLTESAVLGDATIVDLLQGAAQGDDLTTAPVTTVERLQKAVARVRFDPSLEDGSDPHAVAALAVVEVLDPASDVVAVQEVLARATFATVECRTRAETLHFLVAADLILSDDQSPRMFRDEL